MLRLTSSLIPQPREWDSEAGQRSPLRCVNAIDLQTARVGPSLVRRLSVSCRNGHSEFRGPEFRGQSFVVSPELALSETVPKTPVKVAAPQCVGEMIFCVHEPQYAGQDPSFGYNI
jgi:hypothetical protein